jgi:hypothetical protein
MTQRAIAIAALATLAGCGSGGPEPDPPNPARLWLGPGALEIDARLVPEEPEPY